MIRFLFFLFFLSLFSAQTIRRIQQDPIDIFVLKDWKTYTGFTRITGIVESHNMIYFSTNGAGLLRFDKLTHQFIYPLTRSNGLRSNNIQSIYTSRQDSAFVEKRSILLKTNRGSQVITLEQSDNFNLSTEDVSSFQRDRLAMPLQSISDKDQFALEIPYHYGNGIISGDKFEDYRVSGKFIDSERSIWLIVNNVGFFYSENPNGFFKLIRHGPVSRNVLSITSYQNNIYMGLSSNQRISPVLARWNSDNTWDHWRNDYLSQLHSTQIHKVVVFKDTLWLGGNFGLASYDIGRNEFHDYRFRGLYDTKIYDIFPYKNELLIGTDKGLWIYTPRSKNIRQLKFKRIGNIDIFSVAENDRYIFAVSRFGIFKIDKKNKTLGQFHNELSFPSLKTTFVRYIDKKFWFNNSDGIFFFDPKTDKKTQIVLTSMSFQLGINDIEIKGENIFLATNKGLLIYYKKIDYWVWITKREGLPSNHINDIELKGDFLLIATGYGISKFYWKNETKF